jgi:RIP metalloprotease RseP
LEVEGTAPTFLNGGLVGLMADKKAGEDIVLKIDRNGEIMDIVLRKYQEYEKDEEGNVVNDTDGNPIVIGTKVGIRSEYVPLSFGQSLLQCVPYTFNMGWECLKIVGKLFTGQIGVESVGGPITTVQTIVESTQASMKNLILLFPLLAVNLAVFNLLPIPALDGARMVFVLIEWIFRKPVPREIEAKIHNAGLLLLLGLVVVIDLLHIFLF